MVLGTALSVGTDPGVRRRTGEVLRTRGLESDEVRSGLTSHSVSEEADSMKVYLDVCCYCRPYDDQSQARIRLEAEAIVTILASCESRALSLVGSETVDLEVARIPDFAKRRKVRQTTALASHWQEISEDVLSRAAMLQEVGIRAMDALHIACASVAQADVFLTTDDELERKARGVESSGGITVINPIQWLVEVRLNEE